MTGTLDGVTVVEVGQFVSVPFCGQLMADAGARVIKVEPPGGDAYRRSLELAPRESRQFAIKNRGKESVALDLARPETAAVLDRLLGLADVLLVNMSPAAVARHGLDHAFLAPRWPRLVHGTVTGYGTTGPDAWLPGMDVVIQAHSGLVSALEAESGGVPRHSEVQVADYTSALLLLAGVSMALLARERTGRGQQVDVSLLAAALTVQNNQLSHLGAVDGWRHGFVAVELPRLRRAGAGPQEIADARAAHQIAGMPVERLRTGSDAVRDELAALFAGGDAADWVARLRAAGIPCARVRMLDEVLTDPDAVAAGLLADVEHPALGPLRALGAPIGFGDTPADPHRPSPPFAAHTTGVLDELGFTPDEIGGLLRCGAAVAADDDPTDRTGSCS